ncbi:hypothetical protein ACS0TY_010048 [Phlomoides rotata]
MASLKLDVEKFSRKNDFGLWKVKMKALLIQHGLAGALKLDGEEESSNGRDKKIKIMEKTHNAIILCLRDKPFRDFSKEKISIDVWKKLESLYQTKYMDDLEDLDVKLEDDDKALMLLNALPKSLK